MTAVEQFDNEIRSWFNKQNEFNDNELFDKIRSYLLKRLDDQKLTVADVKLLEIYVKIKMGDLK